MFDIRRFPASFLFAQKELWMKEIYHNLFIGNDNDCGANGFAIIHACKTCHQTALNYTKSLSADNENYLIYESEKGLYLNMVDMPNEFMREFANPMFERAMDFIALNIPDRKVLIHCNQGVSRSASLGLLYLARNNIIPNDSYPLAHKEFVKLYPNYAPGNGIRLYMENNWDYLIRINS
jgi:hypothetical protein